MKKIVKLFLFLKEKLKVKTYVLESAFVFIVLAIGPILLDNSYEEWIAVFAVFFTFCHASVANRMQEQESNKAMKGEEVSVSCYKMSSKYFILKESLWFVYFLYIQSYSALIGVVLFLFYESWRKSYRYYSSVQKH